jgi:steroid 5-alpha reductase family enzyme
MKIFLLCLASSIIVNLLMFVPAFIKQTDTLTDISYAVSFVGVVVFAWLQSDKNLLHTLLLVAVLLWAIRLGAYLLRRIRHIKVDHRFDEMRGTWHKFIGFWLIQGLTVAVVLTSVIAAMQKTSTQVTTLSVVGFAIFGVGLVLEATADQQKWKYITTTKDKKWIETGVWSWSRHPNYLGEMLVWWGLYIAVLPSLSGIALWVSLASPVYITALLMFVSGIPLLEKSADKKWGADEKYVAYKKRVPVLIPRLVRAK